jgi:hypothetical protein
VRPFTHTILGGILGSILAQFVVDLGWTHIVRGASSWERTLAYVTLLTALAIPIGMQLAALPTARDLARGRTPSPPSRAYDSACALGALALTVIAWIVMERWISRPGVPTLDRAFAFGATLFSGMAIWGGALALRLRWVLQARSTR